MPRAPRGEASSTHALAEEAASPDTGLGHAQGPGHYLTRKPLARSLQTAAGPQRRPQQELTPPLHSRGPYQTLAFLNKQKKHLQYLMRGARIRTSRRPVVQRSMQLRKPHFRLVPSSPRHKVLSLANTNTLTFLTYFLQIYTRSVNQLASAKKKHASERILVDQPRIQLIPNTFAFHCNLTVTRM